MKLKSIEPSRALYNQVRGGLISQGTTLSEWCRQRNISQTNARAALTGAWNGPKGQALRKRLVNASGITATGDM